VLIQANQLLAELAEERSQLAHDTLTTPPPDYATLMRVVGQYQAILDQEARVRALSKQEDDR
jgi:hypothetical protein